MAWPRVEMGPYGGEWIQDVSGAQWGPIQPPPGMRPEELGGWLPEPAAGYPKARVGSPIPGPTPTPHPWDRPATGPLRQPEADWGPTSPEMQSWTGAFGRPDPGYWYEGRLPTPDPLAMTPQEREWRGEAEAWRRANLEPSPPSPIPGFDPRTGQALVEEMTPFGADLAERIHILPSERWGKFLAPGMGGFWQPGPTIDIGQRRYQPLGPGMIMQRSGEAPTFRHELSHAVQGELWGPESEKRFWQSLPAQKTALAKQFNPYPGQWGTTGSFDWWRRGPYSDPQGFSKGAYWNKPTELAARLVNPYGLYRLPEKVQQWFPQLRAAPAVSDEEAAAMGWRYNPWGASDGEGFR